MGKKIKVPSAIDRLQSLHKAEMEAEARLDESIAKRASAFIEHDVAREEWKAARAQYVAASRRYDEAQQKVFELWSEVWSHLMAYIQAEVIHSELAKRWFEYNLRRVKEKSRGK